MISSFFLGKKTSLPYAPSFRSDFTTHCRKGQLKEVRWAGNPYEKAIKPGSQYLEPRASFKRWTETVVGMSKEWTDDQSKQLLSIKIHEPDRVITVEDTAAVLSLLYGRFIEVWRQKESAVQKSRMTRLLLRNSSHEGHITRPCFRKPC